MAEDTEEKVVVPGSGPGAGYVSKFWVVALTCGFIALAVGLMVALLCRWPDCPSDLATPGTQASSPANSSPTSEPPDTSSPATSEEATSDEPTSEPASGGPAKKETGKTSNTGTLRVDEVSPGSGDSAGGTRVKISGDGFQEGASVKFGGVSALEVAFVNPQLILATTPAHGPGTVDVRVKAGDKAVPPLLDAFTYVECAGAQVVLLLVLLAGALGGTLHSIRSLSWYVGNRYLKRSWVPRIVFYPITGSGLACIFYLCLQGGILPDKPSTRLWIVGVSSLVGLFSQQAFEKLKIIAEAIFSTAPSGADKPKTAPAASTPPPVDPPSGPSAGGNTVKITGKDFKEGTTVEFGAVPAPEVKVDGPTTLSVVVPAAQGAGAVDVVVTVPGGTPLPYPKGYTYT